MRTRIISLFIIFVALTFLGPALNIHQSVATTEMSLKQKVNSLTTNTIRNVNIRKNLKDKIKDLEKLISEIKVLRTKQPRQHVQDELFLDHFVGALQLIPLSSFKKESCQDYRNKIIGQYEPKSTAPAALPIQRAFEVLEAVCR
jgi:hypothetical protein